MNQEVSGEAFEREALAEMTYIVVPAGIRSRDPLGRPQPVVKPGGDLRGIPSFETDLPCGGKKTQQREKSKEQTERFHGQVFLIGYENKSNNAPPAISRTTPHSR